LSSTLVEATRFMSHEHVGQLRSVVDKIQLAWGPAVLVTHYSVADLLGATPSAVPTATPAAVPAAIVDLIVSEEEGPETPSKDTRVLDPFAADWDPSAFASEAASQGGLGRMADNKRALGATTTPSKTPVEPTATVTPTKEPATKKAKVQKGGGEKATGQKEGGEKVNEEGGGGGAAKAGRESIFAPGIGKLHLSLSQHRSELTYTELGTNLRRHLFTLSTDQLPEHVALACALVRLAASSGMTADDLRLVQKEQLKQAKARRAQ
jgi:hypothetical protein